MLATMLILYGFAAVAAALAGFMNSADVAPLVLVIGGALLAAGVWLRVSGRRQ